jgi:hypothetical protein
MAERKNLAALIKAPDPAPAPPPARPDRSAKPDSPAEEAPVVRPSSASDMTMRSWYMPKASADRLAALVDDVHFATRLPKHLVMAAVVNVLDRHRAEVEAEARSAAGQ